MHAARSFLIRALSTATLLMGASLGLQAQTAAGAATAVTPVRTAAPTSAEGKRDYVVGSGDVIRISVYQNPDLSLETRVSESGFISFPLLGQVKLSGQSVVQAEKTLADGLRNGNFVRQPQVTVLVTQIRGNQVAVLGMVGRPGRYPLEAAGTRMTDVLAQAGGISPAGSDVVIITGQRDGKPFRKEINVGQLFTQGGSEDPALQNEDVLFIDRMPLIYIYGEVQRPGTIRLERGMSVMQALATGGGLTARGTEKGLRVHRRGPDGKIVVIQPAMDDPIQSGDVIYVRESIF